MSTKVDATVTTAVPEDPSVQIGDFFIGKNSGNLFLQTNRGSVCVAVLQKTGYPWKVGELEARITTARAVAKQVTITVEV